MRAILFLLLACACAAPVRQSGREDRVAQEESVRDFLGVLPLIIETVPQGVRTDRPLLLDFRSILLAGNSVTGRDLDPGLVRGALPEGFRDVPTDRAIIRHSEFEFGVVDQGIHIRLDGLSRTGRVYRAFVTYRYQDLRNSRSAVGGAQIYVTFEQTGGRWRQRGVTTLGTS